MRSSMPFGKSYHKNISRGKGKSAVAAAAYRAGEKNTNEFDGMIHDYTHKGGVVHTEILLPDRALRQVCGQGGFMERSEENREGEERPTCAVD